MLYYALRSESLNLIANILINGAYPFSNKDIDLEFMIKKVPFSK